MKRQRRLYQLGVGAGLSTMVFGAVVAIAPVAGAEHGGGHDRNPPGNNGTVKIDGVLPVDGPGHGPGPNDAGQHPDNDPHVECAFELEFFGFDTDQTAEITITSHAPTDEGGDLLVHQERVISDDSAGPPDGENPDRDAVLLYDLSGALESIEPHPIHGWHVKLALTIYNADGTEMVPGGKKHKVFWIEECQPPVGSITVEKDVTGDGAPDTGEPGEPEYRFTLACVFEGEAVDLTPDDDSTTDASFGLTDGEDRSFSDLPVGAECTITETDAQGATTTTMTVGDTVLADDAETEDPDGTVTVTESNTTVLVANDYPVVAFVPTELDHSVDIDKLNDADRRGGFRDSETAEGAGDDVRFQITIRNTGDGPLVLQSLTDSVPGRATVDLLRDDVGLVCTGAVPDLRVGSVLPVGSVTVCTFVLDDYAPDPGQSVTNTVTVVTDRASDTDTSTVDTDEEVVVLPAPPVVRAPIPAPPPAVLPVGGAPLAPAPVAAPSPPAPQVLGDVVTRSLPRTGGDSRGLTGMGAFLVAAGTAMVLGSRRRLAR